MKTLLLLVVPLGGLKFAASFQDPEPAAMDTVADRVARLDQIVGELITLSRGDGEEARQAMEALLRTQLRIGQEQRRRVQQQVQASVPTPNEQDEWVEAVCQVEDATLREQALSEIEAALAAGPESARLAACRALTRCGKVEFDKARFRAPLLTMAASSGPLRITALYALFNNVHQPEDLALALALVDDPSAEARRSGPHLLSLFSDGDLTGTAGAAVVQLFQRSAADERPAMLNGLHGARVSPDLESLVLGYSRSADRQESQDAVHALSTFEDKSASVIGRLIELMPSPDPNITQSVLWGLGQGVPEEHAHLVADAAWTFLEARSDPGLKVIALHLIGQYGGAPLAPALQTIADDGRQPDMVRNAARAALEQVLAH